jgi:phage shock protein E
MKVLFIMGALFMSVVSCASVEEEATNQTEKTNQTETSNQSDMKTIIVDVRTIEEWNDGHAPCSVNYPLDMVQSKAAELKNYDKVVLVCRSGARAGSAKAQLESLGVKNIENLGPWQNVKCN